MKPMRLEYIANAPIEALHYPVGLGRPGLGQPVLDAKFRAQPVELMFSSGLALARGKQAVCELFAVVRQQLDDPQRAGLVHGLQETACARGRLVTFNHHEHPARGPVDGHEQVAAPGLIGHLRQILDVHVQVARLVCLEGFVWLLRFDRLEGVEVAYAVAAQTAVQP